MLRILLDGLDSNAFIRIGDSVSITIDAVGYSNLILADSLGGGQSVADGQVIAVNPPSSISYVLTGDLGGKTREDLKAITVDTSPLDVQLRSNGYKDVCEIVSGDAVNFYCVGTNAVTLTLSGGVDSITVSSGDVYTLYPTATTTYTLVGTPAVGNYQDSVVVNVIPYPIEVTILANGKGEDITIYEGQELTLSFESEGGSDLTLTYPDGSVEAVLSESSILITPSETGVYRVELNNPFVVRRDSVRVTVIPDREFDWNFPDCALEYERLQCKRNDWLAGVGDKILVSTKYGICQDLDYNKIFLDNELHKRL